MEFTAVIIAAVLTSAPVPFDAAGASDAASATEAPPANFDAHITLDSVSPGMVQDEPVDDDGIDGWFTDKPAPAFGTAGSMRLNFQGGFGWQPHDDAKLALGGAGVSYFMIDNLSIDLELNGLYISQDPDDTAGVNLNLMLRYHVLARETWSLYVDGGAGLLFTGEDVPEDGTEYNFTPQAGGGVTFDVGSGNRLFAGVRWYHISNANLGDNNPGGDHIYVYAGLSVPF